MPDEQSTFSADLWYIIKNAIAKLQPNFSAAIKTCVSLIGIVLIISVASSFNGAGKQTVELVGTISVSILLMQSSNLLIRLGVSTIQQISEYAKLLLPVMTSAMAAEGAITTSAALYTGTVLFNTLLSSAITRLIIPMVYIYIVLSIVHSAIGEELIERIRDFIKWLMTWSLKIAVYLFTGYIGITGVISGTADAVSVKAAKLALSGLVPVIGNIISDASETILISAGVMKNAVGVYGLLAIIALCIGPFLQIGMQYLLLKISGAVCSTIGTNKQVKIIDDFTSVMGFLLGMTGTVCLIHLISTVCIMKGVT
ncbi:MAG: stage III sporulation protein AE [Oscillospiraceae bacterium]|nr:stage III sporulation protein AE [Oscillospiraceae bacterium]